jgi:hypothetical protein
MPRPCQKRRESAAAQRKSQPNPKPSGPAPIRHKARQKAIHNNVRRGRGGARGGGRGGGRGGRPSQKPRHNSGIDANQDFVSFSSTGNNYHLLNRAGTRRDPITFDDDDDDDSLEDSLSSDQGSDTDTDTDTSSGDSDMLDAEALTINVQVDQMQRARPARASVMFPVREAIAIYRTLYAAGFPLLQSSVQRYGKDGFDAAPAPTVSAEMPQYSRVAAERRVLVPPHPGQVQRPVPASSSFVSPPSASNGAHAYTFDWGVHSGKQFAQIPNQYLKMIGGNPTLFDKHPGLREAFDFHRPGMRRTGPSKKALAKQAGEPVQASSRDRHQGTRGKAVSWVNFRFPSGTHKQKKLNEVPENYLRTIEGMDHVMNRWAGLKEALLDFNMKTGRQSKPMS